MAPKAPKTNFYIEVGSGGLRRSGGYIHDDLPSLLGPSGMRVYREMSRTDPLLFGLTQALAIFMRKARWAIQPPPAAMAMLREQREQEAKEQATVTAQQEASSGGPNVAPDGNDNGNGKPPTPLNRIKALAKAFGKPNGAPPGGPPPPPNGNGAPPSPTQKVQPLRIPTIEVPGIGDPVRWLNDELFERMETPFAEVMSEAASAFVFGFAPCEFTLARRDKGVVGVEGIRLRAQDTIERWEYDEDERHVLGFHQVDYIRPSVYVPLAKVLNFRTSAERGNPEGLSLLRGAYKPYLQKKAFEENEARIVSRAGGVVRFFVPPEIMDKNAPDNYKALYTSIKTMADDLAYDRQGAIILPNEVDPETKLKRYEIDFMVADTRRSVDTGAIIERLDKRMAASVLGDWLLLGQQAVGSYSMSVDKTSLFLLAISGYLELWASEFNRKLLPLLWKLNGWPVETMPKLMPLPVERQNVSELATFLKTLHELGWLPKDNAHRNAALRAGSLPEVEPDEPFEEPVPEQPPMPPGADGEEGLPPDEPVGAPYEDAAEEE